MIQLNEKWFLGTDIGLSPDYDIDVEDGDIAVIEAENCLRENLMDRLLTDRGGLLLHPEFGADLVSTVGARIGQADTLDLKAGVKQALLEDPRVAEVLELAVLSPDDWEAWLAHGAVSGIDQGLPYWQPLVPGSGLPTTGVVAIAATVKAVNGQVVGNIVFPFEVSDLAGEVT